MTHLGHGVMSPALRAEPVGTRKEIRLENRLQDQLESTLDHPIPQRGDGDFILPLLQSRVGIFSLVRCRAG